MIKLLILSAMLIISTNARECSHSILGGIKITTMDKTYKNHGDSKTMWLTSEKTLNEKIIEYSKYKVEILDNKIRILILVEYDENGIVKKSIDSGEEFKYHEIVPRSSGAWTASIINGWEYMDEYDNCQIISAIGDIRSRHNSFDISKVHRSLREEYKKDPMKSEEMNNPDGWEKIWINMYIEENDPKKLGSK